MATDLAPEAADGLPEFDGGADDGVGAMLKKRRIALGLSHADVANVLKVGVRRIDAMETERWEELPSGPFLRGFLRNYARALKIDADALTERVDASLMRARNPESILMAPETLKTTMPRRSGPAEERNTARKLIYGAFVFALLAALIAWSGTDSFGRISESVREWFAPQTSNRADAVASPSRSAPVVGRREAVDAARATPTAFSDVMATKTGGEVRTVAFQNRTASRHSEPAANAALIFHFDDEAWVEVRDGDGKILLSRLNAVGTDQMVAGIAPFKLIVGNAKGVSLRYRGRPVNLAPHTRERVARLTLQ